MHILLIEDDPVHRAFFKEVIEGALPECERLYEAEDGLAGERLAQEFAYVEVLPKMSLEGVARVLAGAKFIPWWRVNI